MSAEPPLHHLLAGFPGTLEQILLVFFAIMIALWLAGPRLLKGIKRSHDRPLRNSLTLLVAGPIVGLLHYAVYWAIDGIHPLDRWFYLVRFLVIGAVAGAMAAIAYVAYWLVNSHHDPRP